MRQYRPLIKPGVPFDWLTHRYLAGIYADDSQRMVLCKAGQMGVSEYLVSWMLWHADQMGSTGLYVFPTDSHVSDFSAARLGPAIERDVSPYLADLIVSAVGESRGADRVGLKRVRDRFVYFRGAKVQPDGRAPQLRSIDADALVLDEFDEMDRRAPGIARERLGHSAVAAERSASTPTYANVGIHAEYLASDQHEWHLRCQACGEWQAPGLENLITEQDDLGRPVRWNTAAGHGLGGLAEADDHGEPELLCRKCRAILDRLAPGEWVAAYPGRPVRGYQITGLISPRKPLSDIIGRRDGERATGLQSTDESDRQQVYNQKLGLTYRSSQVTSLADATLDGCRRGYALGPAPGETWMGVDVGRVLHVVIRGIGDGSDRPARWIGTVSGFDDLGRLMAQHGVKVCVVDALPETREARKFQANYGTGRVWLAYFGGGRAGLKDESPYAWNDGERTVTVDRTRTLDHVTTQFFLGSRSEGGYTLPANARDIADYYAQIKAPERRLETAADGNRVAVYVETGPDHYMFAEVYCAVAMAGTPARLKPAVNPFY